MYHVSLVPVEGVHYGLDIESSPFDVNHLVDCLVKGLRCYEASDNVVALINLLLVDAAAFLSSSALTRRDDGSHCQFIRYFCHSAALQSAVLETLAAMKGLPEKLAQQRRLLDDECYQVLKVARRVVSTAFDEGGRGRET